MNAEAEGRAAAARFRQEHQLGDQPLGDLVTLIEQASGVDVAVLDAGPDEHGLTMRDPQRGAIFIGVARTTRPMRQRSTLAHELAHVLFGDWAEATAGDWSDRSPAEIRADAFARHLLVPIRGLRQYLGTAPDVSLSTLSRVVQRFLVSPALAVIALEQAGYIDAPTKDAWRTVTATQLAVQFGWSDQYQALRADANRRRAPQRLLARAIRGYAEGVLSAQAIATLRGITPQAAEAELRDAGIVPEEHGINWAASADLPVVDVDMAALDEDLGSTALDKEPRVNRARPDSPAGPTQP